MKKSSYITRREETAQKRIIWILLGSAISVVIIVIIYFATLPIGPIGQFTMQQNLAKIDAQTCGSSSTISNDKIVILTFDDSRKSQYLYAFPILEKCSFKATFFTVCNYLGQDSTRMTWDDIATLQNGGQDIESHSMNHYDLTHLSTTDLNYEIGQSQKCLQDHHINSTVFASPYGNTWNDKTVVDTVSKYYRLERDGYAPLMLLHCIGWTSYTNQTDCRTYSNDGSLNFASRYSIRAWDHNYYDISLAHNSTKIFEIFVKEVNSQSQFNGDGTIRAIPILAYHNIDFVDSDYNTHVDLFAKEMEYLHENGFKVITMSDLEYNEKSNYLYIKQ